MVQTTPKHLISTESPAFVAFLTGLTSLGPLSVDMLLPSLPALSRTFATPEATIQLSVTLFVVAFAPSQLIFGPLSDRIGRKPALQVGLLAFLVSGFACLFAPTVEIFIAARVLQGLSAGSGPAISRAMVRDVFDGARAAQVFAHVTTAIALAPMLAPVIGGVLEGAFGWRSVFVVLSGLAVAFMPLVLFGIKETNRHLDPHALNARRWAANHRILLGDRAFMATALLVSLSFSGQFIFISNSAFVLIDLLGVSPQVFGFCFAAVASALAVGAFTGGRLVPRIGLRHTMVVGISFGCFSGLVLAGLVWGGVVWVEPEIGGGVGSSQAYAIAGIIAPMFCFAMGFSIARPPAMATALMPYPHMAGVASAFLGFLQMMIGGLAAVAFGYIYDGTPRPMAAGVAGAGVLAMLFFLLLYPRRERDPKR